MSVGGGLEVKPREGRESAVDRDGTTRERGWKGVCGYSRRDEGGTQMVLSAGVSECGVFGVGSGIQRGC